MHRGLTIFAVGGFLVSLAAASEGGGEPLFTDVTTATGLDFVHFNGMSGRFYYPEVVGSGGALFDMDNDGDLDLYLVQGAMLGPDRTLEDAFFPPVGSTPPRDRLYRNDLRIGADGRRSWRFVDVTDESGLSSTGYGIGVATGDYDGDGFVDLYVTNFGSNELWRNRGDGTFEDRTEEAGVGGSSWSSSASFLDYDADGDLDLIVANYLEFSWLVHKVCTTERGEPDYCLPRAYQPARNRLYRNLGHGKFEDVTEASGVARNPGNSLGVVSADFDGNGSLDLYVANDLTPNFLLLNQGDGTFVDEGLLRGAALNAVGEAEASMGVDAADFDADGDVDLFVTHFSRESNTLYVNHGDGFFRDASDASGLAHPSWRHTAFGTGWIDYDLDGRLDLVVLNGGVTYPPGAERRNGLFPLDEPNQLYRNLGDGRFEEVPASAGSVFQVSEISRGAVLGDIDNDGDVDIVITNNNGPARVWRNNADVSRPWIGLRLLDSGVDAIGARAAISWTGSAPIWRRVRTDGSYASARDARILAALGEAPRGIETAEVRVFWADGRAETFQALGLRRYTTLRAGSGVALP